eukprot:Pgem_evm1s3504
MSGIFAGVETATETKNIFKIELKQQCFRVERCKLLQSLVSQLKPGVMNYSRKVLEIEEKEGEGASIVFMDGTKSKMFDIVIGADGCHSRVARTRSLFDPVKVVPS